MKFASFSITALAATFLVGLTYGGFPDEDEGSLSRHQARKMENANYNGVKSKDDDDTIDLIVTYKNEAVSQFLSTSCHVVHAPYAYRNIGTLEHWNSVSQHLLHRHFVHYKSPSGSPHCQQLQQ